MLPTRTILVANPSFEHPVEKRFWLNFRLALQRHQWECLFHSARSGDDVPYRIQIPARLMHLPRFSAELPLRTGKFPEWMSASTIDLLVDWEHKRWGLKYYETRIWGGLMHLSWHVDRLFQGVRPAACFSSNKIDHGCLLFKLAADHYGVPYRFVERSPLDSMLFETSGMFAESDIFEQYDAESNSGIENRLAGESALSSILENVSGFRLQASLDSTELRKIRSLPRPLVLLSMDNALWTGWAQPEHPQGDVDYPEDFRDPSAVIQKIAKRVELSGGTLILKLHPADREVYFSKTANIPDNVEIVTNGLEDLLWLANASIVFLSKVAFPSLCLGIPTAVLSTNTASIAGVGEVFSNQEELDKAIDVILNESKGFSKLEDEDRERLVDFLGFLATTSYVDTEVPINLGKPNVVSLAEDCVSAFGENGTIPASIGVEAWDYIKQNTMRKSMGRFVDDQALYNSQDDAK